MFARAFGDPLTNAPVAASIKLDVRKPVEVAVSVEHSVDLLLGMEFVEREDRRTCGADPRADDQARVDQVLVGEHVDRQR